jgi:hypothetical protein
MVIIFVLQRRQRRLGHPFRSYRAPVVVVAIVARRAGDGSAGMVLLTATARWGTSTRDPGSRDFQVSMMAAGQVFVGREGR